MTELIARLKTFQFPKIRLPAITDRFKQEAGLTVGFLLFGYGIYTIYPPAAFIICGAMLMYFFFPRGGE